MSNSSFTDRIRSLIANSPKSEQQIAQEIGYSRGSIVAMFKVGATKVPLEKVPLLARSLGVDVAELCRLALEESSPAILRIIREHPEVLRPTQGVSAS